MISHLGDLSSLSLEHLLMHSSLSGLDFIHDPVFSIGFVFLKAQDFPLFLLNQVILYSDVLFKTSHIGLSVLHLDAIVLGPNLQLSLVSDNSESFFNFIFDLSSKLSLGVLTSFELSVEFGLEVLDLILSAK